MFLGHVCYRMVWLFLQSFIWQIIRKQISLRTWSKKFLCSNEFTAYRPLACGSLSLFIMCYHMVVCNHVRVVTGRCSTLFPQMGPFSQPPGMGLLNYVLIKVSLFLPVFHSVLKKYQILLFLKIIIFENMLGWSIVLIISIDRPVDLLPLDTSHWTIFVNVCVHFILRRWDLNSWRNVMKNVTNH